MGREIIQNEIDSFSSGILVAQAFERTQSLLPALAPKEVSPELITVDIKERQQVSDPVRAGVGRRETLRMPPSCPVHSILRPQFKWAKFVKANNTRTFGRFPVQSGHSFFLTSKSGSFDSFHVLVRWWLTRCSLRIVRKVSILIFDTTLVLIR